MSYGDTLNWQSISASAAPALQTGEVHLWWLALEVSDEQLEEFSHLLSDKQQQKMQRFPSEEKRRRYLAGRGFLHQLLCAYLNVDSVELEFGRYGKPALKNAKIPLRFNFSDTCGYGLFAFSLNDELGVDLESTARQGRFQQIIDRRFAPSEKDLINGENTEQFLACWTRKEAYGKAIGVGLSYALDEHVLCDSLMDNTSTSPDGNWCLQQIAIKHEKDEFIACVTSAGRQAKRLKAFNLVDEEGV